MREKRRVGVGKYQMLNQSGGKCAGDLPISHMVKPSSWPEAVLGPRGGGKPKNVDWKHSFAEGMSTEWEGGPELLTAVPFRGWGTLAADRVWCERAASRHEACQRSFCGCLWSGLKGYTGFRS